MKISNKERIMMANELMAAWIVHHGSNRQGSGSYSFSAKTAANEALGCVDALIESGKSFRWFDEGYK